MIQYQFILYSNYTTSSYYNITAYIKITGIKVHVYTKV